MSEVLGTLLLVDDNQMNRDQLSRRLERRGYEVITAEGGQQALDLIAKHKFDLVLLDIMMPEMSGWEVLERVRKKLSRLDLPVIMATAKDDSEDVIRALSSGASDYVTKPFDLEIVLARVGTHVILKRTYEKLHTANQKLKDDLAAASRIQQTHLPARTPDLKGCEIAWYYRPCDELGGDFLNVFDLGSDHIGLYLLDVSGHGVPAALMSVAVSRALAPSKTDTCIVIRPSRGRTSNRLEVTPPAEVANRLNRRFPMESDTNQYFTLIYGVLEHQSRTFRFTSAGHPAIIHAPLLEQPRYVEFDGDPPIGVFQSEEGVFGPFQENKLKLQSADRLYLYSDGVVEAIDKEGRLYGADRLLKTIEDASSLSLQAAVEFISESVSQWCGEGNSPQDDVSILALKISD